MQLKTILNRVHPVKGFVYEAAKWVMLEEGLGLEVDVRPRAGTRAVCSGCDTARPGYDTLAPRRYEFVPLWGILVWLVYSMRRVNCPHCGIKVERVPWAEGKHQLCTCYIWFLARWARRLSWKETAEIFRTSWSTVFRSVEAAVEWGRAHLDLTRLTAIGVDEIMAWRGHKYLTLVYQIDEGHRRLLWVGNERKAKTLLRFFRWLGKERTALLRFVCSDMWKPYLKVIARKAGAALHVLDRFHVMSHLNKAVDEVRRKEASAHRAEGKEVLKRSRWCLLKRPENLTEGQEDKLAELLKLNLRSVRAYLLKEQFQFFWSYKAAGWAGRFLDQWCTRAMRSKLVPMKKAAKMLRVHRTLLLNWFRAKGQISAAAVEGFNGKAKLVMKRAYGFRSYGALEVALYHTLGDLPEPISTHRFC
jgi:transposase